jgi:hypothetical protein
MTEYLFGILIQQNSKMFYSTNLEGWIFGIHFKHFFLVEDCVDEVRIVFDLKNNNKLT